MDKQKQLDIILRTNPHNDDLGTHTWIRSISDIKTYDEVWEEEGEIYGITPDFSKEDVINALKTRKMMVYSSYPIENGIFVTPSRMEAANYSGNGKVYSKMVDLDDVAWIDTTQGQYAKVSENIKENKKSMKQIIRLTENELHSIIKESVNRILKENEWDTFLQQDDDEPTSFRYDDVPSNERIANEIIDDIRNGGYDIRGKSLYDFIEDLMINYACSANIAKLVADKLGIK